MKLGIKVMDLMKMCFGLFHNSIHKNIETLKDIIIIVKCTYTIICYLNFSNKISTAMSSSNFTNFSDFE
jgi:hypothetical protein